MEEEEATFHIYIYYSGVHFILYAGEVRYFFLVGLDELLDRSI